MTRPSRLAGATLGILAGNPAARVDGGIVMNHSNARTFRELRRRAGRALLGISVLPRVAGSMNDRLEWPAEDLVALPPMASTMSAQRHLRAARRAAREVARRSDVLFVRIPFQIPWALLRLGRPKLLHLAGDVYEVVRCSSDYRGWRRGAALAMARASEWTFRALARETHTRVAANGSALAARYGRPGSTEAVVSSCLYRAEMVPRRSFALPPVPRLLFVGYLRPEKGLPALLDAFDRLRARRPLTLTLVGGQDRARTAAEEALLARLEASPYRADIERRDQVPFGEELFALYRNHDLLLLPSLSEGTPRVLIEARAFGLPVVATRVGGIPDSVTDGIDGLLVPPADGAALAAAVERLLADEELRLGLISAGLERARSTSLEDFIDRLAAQLEELVPEGRPAPLALPAPHP